MFTATKKQHVLPTVPVAYMPASCCASAKAAILLLLSLLRNAAQVCQYLTHLRSPPRSPPQLPSWLLPRLLLQSLQQPCRVPVPACADYACGVSHTAAAQATHTNTVGLGNWGVTPKTPGTCQAYFLGVPGFRPAAVPVPAEAANFCSMSSMVGHTAARLSSRRRS